MLGDVAIACNPNDERYRHLIGKSVKVPFVNRCIPIIQDSYVKPEFGSGAVKITPSHDKDDYDVAKRHGLSAIDVIDKKGCIYNTNTEFDGLKTKIARGLIIEELYAKKQVDKITDYNGISSTCYRCKNNIETLISDQWFVKTEKLREQALSQVNTDEVKLVPETFKATINRWLSNDVDWCISRSLWWGHQIPIFYCQDCKFVNCDETNVEKCKQCSSTNLIRDTDVLDTWFSSALWAFSVFDSEEELEYYFPSDVLVTGSDILFFWVARMMMITSELKKEIPFKNVFLHGIIRDEQGVKMSKTLGKIFNFYHRCLN